MCGYVFSSFKIKSKLKNKEQSLDLTIVALHFFIPSSQCSELSAQQSPGTVWGTIWNSRNWTQVDHIPIKCPTLCPTASILMSFFFFWLVFLFTILLCLTAVEHVSVNYTPWSSRAHSTPEILVYVLLVHICRLLFGASWHCRWHLPVPF